MSYLNRNIEILTDIHDCLQELREDAKDFAFDFPHFEYYLSRKLQMIYKNCQAECSLEISKKLDWINNNAI